MTDFEKQTGTLAVAGLRLHQALKARSTEIPENELELLVADTLDSPYEVLPYIPRSLEPTARSRRRASEIKRLRQVLVIIRYNRRNAANATRSSRASPACRTGIQVTAGGRVFATYTIAVLQNYRADQLAHG